MVNIFDMVYTVDMVDAVDMVDTVDTVDTEDFRTLWRGWMSGTDCHTP